MADYVCQSILVTIPKHPGLIFISPLDRYNSYGGGLNALSGAQIRAINDKYGKYVEGVIPAENYAFLTIMDSNSLEIFSKVSFKSKNGIKRKLKSLSIFYTEYDGIFDSRILIQRFPYLQEFFNVLDEWRLETGRVTLDNDILQIAIKKTLGSQKCKFRKRH